MARSIRAVALGALLVTQAQSPAPRPPAQGATPSACARPNVDAGTLHVVPPVMPAIAEQQGITGTVQVIVTLDEASHLTGARVQSSPGAFFNAAAIAAARHAAFQAPVRDCRPQGGSFVFSVEFTALDRSEPSEFVGTPDKPAANVSAQGTATREPDVAYVHAVFETRDPDRAAAIARNDAAFASFREALSSLGTGGGVATGYYDVFERAATPPSPVSVAYDAAHEAIVMVAPLERVRDVVSAATKAGASSIALRYSVRDKRALYDAALADAVAASAAEARRIAREHGMQVGEVIGTTATFGSTDTREPGELLEVHEATGVPAPAPVKLRIRITVTYALRR
jgi:TonB family protein